MYVASKLSAKLKAVLIVNNATPCPDLLPGKAILVSYAIRLSLWSDVYTNECVLCYHNQFQVAQSVGKGSRSREMGDAPSLHHR